MQEEKVSFGFLVAITILSIGVFLIMPSLSSLAQEMLPKSEPAPARGQSGSERDLYFLPYPAGQEPV